MGLFDVFRKSSNEKEIIHIKNLILIASADSVITHEELSVMTAIMLRMNISEDHFQQALNELISEHLISIEDGRISLSNNVLYNVVSYFEVVPADSFDQQLLYLQDYVLVMMSDGVIDEREKRICIQLAHKMGLPTSAVDIVIQMVAQKTKGYGTSPAKQGISNTSKTEPSAKAQRYYNFVKQQANYISENFRLLNPSGLGEAKILCSALFSRLCKDLDEDTGEDFLICLLDDIEEFNPGSGEEQLDFLSERMDFYGDEINSFKQPTYSCMGIYNTLYVNPFTDDPHNLDDVDADPMTLMMLYHTVVEVANNIKRAVGDTMV